MQIKDYVLDEQQLKNIRKAKVKKRHMITRFSILFQSGCDFGIEKKQGRRISQLIILVSQNQYYIKTGEEVQKLDSRNLRSFLSGLNEPLELEKVNWLSAISNDKGIIHGIYDTIVKAVSSEWLHEQVKNGNVYVYSQTEESDFDIPDYSENRPYDLQLVKTNSVLETAVLYKNSLYNWMIGFMAERRCVSKKELFRDILFRPEGKKETRIYSSFSSLCLISKLYGIEWARKAVAGLYGMTLDFEISEDWLTRIIETGSGKKAFAPKPFIEYMIRHPVREGYYDPDQFFRDWLRYLELQNKIYGSIKDKYPGHLASSLMKMQYEERLHDAAEDEKRWKKVADRMKRYEFSDGTYRITYPANKKDMEREARHQHNCILGYIDNVQNGYEMILFMRKNENPDKPLVTIQLSNDGKIGQVFRAFNEYPSREELRFIRKWAKERGLKMPEVLLPPRAAVDFEERRNGFDPDDEPRFGGFNPLFNNDAPDIEDILVDTA